jgi:hypothetical protein
LPKIARPHGGIFGEGYAGRQELKTDTVAGAGEDTDEIGAYREFVDCVAGSVGMARRA